MLPATLQFLIVMIASAINDRLQRKLDYVKEERRILWEKVEALTGGKKISFTAQQRRRLAEAPREPAFQKRQFPRDFGDAALANVHLRNVCVRSSVKAKWRLKGLSTQDPRSGFRAPAI